MEKSRVVRSTERTKWFYQLQFKASAMFVATAAALVFASVPVGLST